MPKIILLLVCLYLNIPVHNGEYLRKAVFPFRVEKFILHTDAKKPIEYDWDSGEDYVKDFSEADIVCEEII